MLSYAAAHGCQLLWAVLICMALRYRLATTAPVDCAIDAPLPHPPTALAVLPCLAWLARLVKAVCWPTVHALLFAGEVRMVSLVSLVRTLVCLAVVTKTCLDWRFVPRWCKDPCLTVLMTLAYMQYFANPAERWVAAAMRWNGRGVSIAGIPVAIIVTNVPVVLFDMYYDRSIVGTFALHVVVLPVFVALFEFHWRHMAGWFAPYDDNVELLRSSHTLRVARPPL